MKEVNHLLFVCVCKLQYPCLAALYQQTSCAEGVGPKFTPPVLCRVMLGAPVSPGATLLSAKQGSSSEPIG